MKVQNILRLLLVSCVFFGCAEDVAVRNIDAGTPFPSKPLPDLCSTDLLARLTWRPDRMAFGFTVEVGTTVGIYSKTFAIPNTEKYFLFTLERGSTYYIRATKHLAGGLSTVREDLVLHVPTCVDRAAWQATHPDYAEPFDYLVTFPL